MTRHWTLSGEVCRILFGRMHFLFFSDANLLDFVFSSSSKLWLPKEGCAPFTSALQCQYRYPVCYGWPWPWPWFILRQWRMRSCTWRYRSCPRLYCFHVFAAGFPSLKDLFCVRRRVGRKTWTRSIPAGFQNRGAINLLRISNARCWRNPSIASGVNDDNTEKRPK